MRAVTVQPGFVGDFVAACESELLRVHSKPSVARQLG